MGAGQTVVGVAQTLNISSGGVLVSAEHEFRPGTQIELILEWPTLLDANVPLQLVTTGRVMHSRGVVCGIAFARYQFRTAKRKNSQAFAAAAERLS